VSVLDAYPATLDAFLRRPQEAIVAAEVQAREIAHHKTFVQGGPLTPEEMAGLAAMATLMGDIERGTDLISAALAQQAEEVAHA